MVYISPCFKTNVDQYIKPLISFKKAQCSPKTGYDAAQMLSCVAIVEQKINVKIEIYSRDLAGVSITLWQRVTFLHL